ncbi:MAG: hypothetical protein LWW95_09595 [Candidatus Desulfofervidus auxilii]|nr:hypothetical protein [Candidatus Desulfofervidus auxilii]
MYNEPFQEEFLRFRNPDFFNLQHSLKLTKDMNHPFLAQSYFAEYIPLSIKISKIFRKEFPYDLYFLSPETQCNNLKKYIDMLINHAKGRPVFKFVRSLFRIRWLKENFNSLNIFLWRNPRDVWESINSMLDKGFRMLLILNSPSKPEPIRELASFIGIDEFHSPDLILEMAYFHKIANRLSPEKHYFVFFTLWCMSFLENIDYIDIEINIDKLSDSQEYKIKILHQMEKYGIKNINFSDCNVRRGLFTKKQKEFFVSIEENVFKFLKKVGYSDREIAKLPEIDYKREFNEIKLQNLTREINFLEKWLIRFNYTLNNSFIKKTNDRDLLIKYIFFLRDIITELFYRHNSELSPYSRQYVFCLGNSSIKVKKKSLFLILSKLRGVLSRVLSFFYFLLSKCFNLMKFNDIEFKLIRRSILHYPTNKFAKPIFKRFVISGKDLPIEIVSFFNENEIKRAMRYFSIKDINNPQQIKKEIEVKLMTIEPKEFLYALYYIIHYRAPDSHGLYAYLENMEFYDTYKKRKLLVQEAKNSDEYKMSSYVESFLKQGNI